MPKDFAIVYDKRTGDKLKHPVPRHWLELFDHYSETPQTKGKTSNPPPAQAEGSSISKEKK